MKNTEFLLVATKEVHLELNAEKSVYYQINAGQIDSIMLDIMSTFFGIFAKLFERNNNKSRFDSLINLEQMRFGEYLLS
jgi:hypothetical protein